MTKSQLEQIFYLTKEKKMWEDKLSEFSDVQAVQFDRCGSGSGGVSSPVEKLAEQREKIRDIISNKLVEISFLEREILMWVTTLDDSLMRQIITQRCVYLKSWQQVANSIGGNNTADSVRMTYNRFFEEKK